MTWEERWHPLREEWVVVAAHRQDRPWSGEKIAAREIVLPEYVPDCYLCPGNTRVSGKANPNYEQIFVFDNDHPSVSFDAPNVDQPSSSVYQVRPAHGVSRVVCYSPRHNLTLAELPADQITKLLRTWQEQYLDLGSRPEIEHVLIFENKGEAVGVSNPHPHCQIYANNFVFKTIANEVAAGRRYFSDNRRILFRTSFAQRKTMAGGSSRRTIQPSRSFHILRDMLTKFLLLRRTLTHTSLLYRTTSSKILPMCCERC
jgi:UDPglucose--hexose-1-phosphate uridylyltransferase